MRANGGNCRLRHDQIAQVVKPDYEDGFGMGRWGKIRSRELFQWVGKNQPHLGKANLQSFNRIWHECVICADTECWIILKKNTDFNQNSLFVIDF